MDAAELKALRRAVALAHELDCALTTINVAGSFRPAAYVLTVPVATPDKALMILNIIADMADDGGAE